MLNTAAWVGLYIPGDDNCENENCQISHLLTETQSLRLAVSLVVRLLRLNVLAAGGRLYLGQVGAVIPRHILHTGQ